MTSYLQLENVQKENKKGNTFHSNNFRTGINISFFFCVGVQFSLNIFVRDFAWKSFSEGSNQCHSWHVDKYIG